MKGLRLAALAHPTPLGQISEKEFQNQVLGLARLCGWKVMHSRPAMDRRGRWSTPISGDKGYPDLTMVHPDGLLVFAELKVGKNGLSLDQEQWIELLFGCETKHVRAYVWTPSDWDEIQQVLEVRAA